jgi:phage FluMu protein Com
MHQITKPHLIINGHARMSPEGMRCIAQFGRGRNKRTCNKVIAKRSQTGQIAGIFTCPRCGGQTEVSQSRHSANQFTVTPKACTRILTL